MANNHGGAAFPISNAQGPIEYGMTMRQYYKAAAMVVVIDGFDHGRATPEVIAKQSGIIADAMIAEDIENAR